MPLRAETVDRVLAMWERWPATNDNAGVSVVTIGDRRFVSAPPHLRGLLVDPPGDLEQLTALLGDEAERVVGIARLAYADDGTLSLPDPGPLARIDDDDPRLVHLEAASDRAEWLESSADEPCVTRVGVVEQDLILAVATLQVWDDTVAHFGVFTRADARGRGLAGRAAAGVIKLAQVRGLVPQWRSRFGNDASAAVADGLGFVPLGSQMAVRVRPHGA